VPQLPVHVTVGGEPAEIVYAGEAPHAVAGMLQVNFRVPESAPLGEAVPLVLTVGNSRSQDGITMAVRSSVQSVLVMDRPGVTRNWIGRVLRRAGYEVLTARNSVEALRQAQEHPVDLIVLNLAIPEGAVANAGDVHAQLVHDGQQTVCLRSSGSAHAMQVAVQVAARVARQQKRQPPVIVTIGIAHRAAIKNQRMIEQLAVAIRRVFQLLQEIRKHADMMPIQLRELGDQIRLPAMVRKRVERRIDRDDSEPRLYRPNRMNRFQACGDRDLRVFFQDFPNTP
jgi:CheY-like chemotaxis protein